MLISELLRMLRFGLPHGLNWFLEFAAFALFINVVVADLGTVVLAAMMVVININSVSFMPAFGLTSAGAILTGRDLGEGFQDQVGMLFRMSKTPGSIRTPAPAVGQHTAELLRELGYTEAEIKPLEKAISTP